MYLFVMQFYCICTATMYCLLGFTFVELRKVNNAYQEKLTAGHAKDQTMFNLSWDIEELKNINEESRKMYHELRSCINFYTHELFQNHNIPKLGNIRQYISDEIQLHMFL